MNNILKDKKYISNGIVAITIEHLSVDYFLQPGFQWLKYSIVTVLAFDNFS